MPTRTSTPPATSARASVSFAGPSAVSFAGATMLLPGPRDAWTWCVSPTALQCDHGAIVPRLAKAWHTPGLGGNGRELGRGEGFVAALRDRFGYLPVPHDIECVAYGETRTVAAPSTYLDRYDGVDVKGRPCVYYTDAWHRPRRLGATTVWDWDADGWRDFLGRCLRLVTPGELDPVQVQIATEPLIRSIRRLLDRKDERAASTMELYLAHLPPDLAPPDLRKRIKRFRAGRETDPEPQERAAV